jgi:hypothetical protein
LPLANCPGEEEKIQFQNAASSMMEIPVDGNTS